MIKMKIDKLKLIIILFPIFNLSISSGEVLYRSEAKIIEKIVVQKEKKRSYISPWEKLKMDIQKIIETKDHGPRTYIDEEGILYTNGRVGFSLESSDGTGIEKVEYRLKNENEFSPYTAPVVVNESGSQTIYYRAKDKLGNKERIKAFSFIVDKKSPVQSFSLKGNVFKNGKILYAKNNIEIQLSSSDDSSGLKNTYIDVNNLGFLPFRNNNYEFNEEGSYDIKIISFDNLLNRTKIEQIRFFVDNTPPSISVSFSKNTPKYKNKQYCIGKMYIKAKATDKGSGVKDIYYRLEKRSNWMKYRKQIAVNSINHLFFIQVVSIDNVGNHSNIIEKKCYIDKRNPYSGIGDRK